MPKFELEKISLVDPSASPDDVVVLTTVLEGAGFATRAFVEDEVDSAIIEDNQTYSDTLTYKLNVGTLYEASDNTQLDTWANNHTKLTFSGYSDDKIAYAENMYLNKRTSVQDRKGFKLDASKTGKNYYDSNGQVGPGFFMGRNLLAMHKFTDESGTGVANGWTDTGFSGTSFASKQQTIEADTNNEQWYKEVYFPFPGKTLTFSVNTISLGTPYTTKQIQLVQYNASGGVVVTVNQEITGTGIVSVSDVIEATTVYVRVVVNMVATSGTATSIVADPMLTIGTSTDYTES